MLIIFLWVFLVYSNALSISFHFDDNHHIERNFHIRKLSNIPSFFKYPKMFSANPIAKMYRPVLLTSYAINYSLHGNNVVGFHAVNIALHGLNSILVFLILLYFFKPYYLICFLVALIYGVNPVNTEAVNLLSSRSDVLSTTFFLFSFYFYVKSKVEMFENEMPVSRLKIIFFYIGSLLSYMLGLLTKVVVITLPLILILYDYMFYEKAESKGEALGIMQRLKGFFTVNSRFSLIKHLPFWIVTVLYLLLRRAVMGSTGVMNVVNKTKPLVLAVGDQINRTYLYQLSQIKATLVYLKLWFFPVGLTVDHHVKLIDIFKDNYIWYYILAFIVLLSLVVLLYKKDKRITFFFAWFIITLLPTSLLPLNTVMAEKRIYLSGIGIAGVVNALFIRVYLRYVMKKGVLYKLFITLIIIIVFIYSVGTFARNRVWKDEYSLWSDAVKKSPDSPLSYQMLGEGYMLKGELNKAINAFERSISLNPRDGRVYNSLGIAFYRKGLFNRAIDSFKKAKFLSPRRSEIYNNLGNVYYKLKDYTDAIDMYNQAIKINPEFSHAYSNMGNVFFVKGDRDKAIYYYKKAVEIDPTNSGAIKYLKRLSSYE